MEKRGQVATEFITLLGMSLILFFTIFYMISTGFQEDSREKEIEIINDLARSVQMEISIALDSYPGYTRTFVLPDTIESYHYHLNSGNNFINITTSNIPHGMIFFIPDIEGEIVKGDNLIRNVGGKVCVGTGVC